MIQFLLGVLAAVALGVVVDVVTGATTRALRAVRRRFSAGRWIRYDVRADGLYMVGEWSPRRRLTPPRLVTDYTERRPEPERQLVDGTLLQEAVVASAEDTGDIAYLTRFRLDHRESERTQRCYVTVAPADYAEVRAIERLRIDQPLALEGADRVLAANPREYLASAVPSSLAVNVVPVLDGRVLCAQRSAAVDNGIGLWTVGVYETLKRPDPNNPGRQEDFYGLAERALEEELGLRGPDVGPIDLTWLGIYRPLLRGHLVAVVPIDVSTDQLAERVAEADSSYEHLDFEFVPLTKRFVTGLVDAPSVVAENEVGPSIWFDGRRWIDQARLAAIEAWRFRSVLETPD